MKREVKMQTRSDPVGLGIMGYSWVAETFHLPAIQKHYNAKVVAVADDDRNRLKRVAEQFHVRKQYPEYLALLENPAVDAVFVCLPDASQAEMAQVVLAAGKHLFIDKPQVFDLKVWDRLIEQAAQAERKILVMGLSRRWHPLMRRAREVIEQGRLGKIHLIRTVMTGTNPERRTMKEVGPRHQVKGLVYEFGMHHFDVLHTLVGSRVEELSAVNSPDDMTILVHARLADGLMVTCTFSEGESYNDEVEIYGQKGRLRLSFYRFDGLELFPPGIFPGNIKVRLQQAVNSLKQLPQGLLQMRQGGDFLDSYRVGWEHGIDAIRHNSRPDCTLIEARNALQLVLAGRESVELGKLVTIAPPAYDCSR
jgi:UDP-N-acetylglucosamine 3-dehydrogenase